jgi:hypothetical protein
MTMVTELVNVPDTDTDVTDLIPWVSNVALGSNAAMAVLQATMQSAIAISIEQINLFFFIHSSYNIADYFQHLSFCYDLLNIFFPDLSRDGDYIPLVL